MGFRSWLSADDLEIRSNWMTEDNTVAVSDPLNNWPSETLSATSLALQVPTAVRCVEIIATQIAQFKFEAWRDDDRLEDQPRVLRRPDPFLERFWFLYGTIVDMLFEGTAAWRHSSIDDTGRPGTLERLPADELSIDWDPSLPVSEAKRLNRRRIKYGGATLDPQFVTLVPMMHVPGEPAGLGPIQAGRPINSGQVAADQMVRSNFTEGHFPSGSIEVPTNLSEKQAERLLTRFMRRGKRAPAVMSGGAQFKPHAITARDAQWIEARQWGAAEVARYFGVPAATLNLPVVGGSQVTYNNSTGIRTELLHTGLSPVIVRLEAAFGSILPSTQDCHADTTKYLPPLEAVVPTAADPNSPPADTPNTPQPQTAEAATGGTEDVTI